MATRSMIAFDNEDKVYAIYCHHDGYPSHNGRILLNQYDDIEKVEELIALGDLSLLSKEIGKKQNFDRPTNHDWCLAYGRDREEKNTAAKEFYSWDEATEYYEDCDYFYVFDGHGWMWKKDNGDWKQLTVEDTQ